VAPRVTLILPRSRQKQTNKQGKNEKKRKEKKRRFSRIFYNVHYILQSLDVSISPQTSFIIFNPFYHKTQFAFIRFFLFTVSINFIVILSHPD